MDRRPADILLEACVETPEQAVLAEQHGADRIELCSELSVGGLTPGPELLSAVLSGTDLPVMAMVRPAPGSFVCDEAQLEQMKKSIDDMGNSGVAGVVFGMLRPNGKIDLDQVWHLAEFAHPLEITFHKAIDLTPDPVEAFRQLTQVPGITRVLTSGGKATALEGQSVIREMLRYATVTTGVLAAGSITRKNLLAVHDSIGASEYHGRRIVF